ncbi:hypothetical protein EV360DRAFT_10907, partial [Lentinula raphanica]
ARAQTSDKEATSTEWYPWRDQMTCTLDILMHLPCSVFSQQQLDLFLWLLQVNGVANVPSVKTMKGLNSSLQKILAQIIAQEMANPFVRPKLHFYPEDSGTHLSEGRQAQRWLNEAPNNLLTPMARINARDFYIHEPAMLLDGSCCIPVRWFSRGTHLYARCWRMETL